MDTLTLLFSDKSTQAKEKVALLSNWLLNASVSTDQVMDFADTATAPLVGSCTEALEQATANNPNLATTRLLLFATAGLSAKAPRVRWESARLIGNIADQFSSLPEAALAGLLRNAKHEGTVVRWSAATALCKLLMHRSGIGQHLRPQLARLKENEEKQSIQKIYRRALQAYN